MNRILTITVCLMMLAGCAGGPDQSAEAGCKPATPPDKQAQWEMVEPGILSMGMDGPTRKRLGIEKSNQKAAATCTRPQTLDLQKIGARPESHRAGGAA